jgi:hypothetical protein
VTLAEFNDRKQQEDRLGPSLVPCAQVIPSADLLAASRAAIEAWAPIANHPHLAAPRSAFVSSELDGSPALFFVHDFHPGKFVHACRYDQALALGKSSGDTQKQYDQLEAHAAQRLLFQTRQ